uniref:Uncharacterized protein n=1 Tax=Rhizophora mucronata TaxID=61149 RepID=A0A2P2INT4_RHIMU
MSLLTNKKRCLQSINPDDMYLFDCFRAISETIDFLN